jgi:hypothetical protein
MIIWELIFFICLPVVLQAIGFRYILRNKELNLFSPNFLLRSLIALFLTVIIYLCSYFLAWPAGKDSYILVILFTLSGFIINLFGWIFIFRSEKNNISLKSSFLGSVLSLTAVLILFANMGKSNLPTKTVNLDSPETFDNIFQDNFNKKSLRNILNKITRKQLVFQYSFIDGDNWTSNDRYLIEIYKSDDKIKLTHRLPLKISDRENFSWLFSLTGTDLIEKPLITKDSFFKNVGHSNSRIYATINEVELNFKNGSYAINSTESGGNGLYSFTDMLISDKKNNLLIYISYSGHNYP